MSLIQVKCKQSMFYDYRGLKHHKEMNASTYIARAIAKIAIKSCLFVLDFRNELNDQLIFTIRMLLGRE